jgi:hypothetical protein
MDSLFYIKREEFVMKKENISNNDEKQPILIGASLFMEEVFQSGLYREMKTAENKLDTIKGTMKKILINGESKRYELPHNLTAKFVPFPKYETDEKGLKEFLDDYGVLPLTVTSLNTKTLKEEPEVLEELTSFQKPIEYYAKINLNSKGKTHLDREEYYFKEDLNSLSIHFIQQKSLLDNCKMSYKNYIKKIEACPFFQLSKSVKSSYGSCTYSKKKVEYDINSIYTELGNHFLIEYGQVSMESIDEFIANGYFSSKDIQKFRKMVDLNLRFVVMDKDSEIKQSEFFQQRLMRNAQKRRFA